MERKSIKLNYLFNATYQVFILITPLITTPYLSRVLQPDGIGRVSYVESIVSNFALVAVMGISIYGQREISYVQDDITKRSEVFWNVKILSFIISGLTILAYILFAVIQKENFLLYFILTLNLISIFIDVDWFFQGMEDFAKTVTRNAVCKILLIVYIFVFVKDKNDLPFYVLGCGLSAVLGSASLWIYLPKYVKKIPFCKLHPFKDFKVVWALFIPTIATQVYTVLDKTMIGLITKNSFENGYYEQSQKIVRLALTLVTAISAVMMPRMGYLFKKKKYDEVYAYMYRGYRFVWFLGFPLCLGIIMTARNFVPWFFGMGYDKVVPNLFVQSIIIPVVGIGNVTGIQYLLPTKRQNLFTYSVVCGAVVNIILNTILIRTYASLGASIASIIAELTVTGVQLVFVRKELSIIQILREGKSYFVAGAIMAMVLFISGKYLSSTIVNTIILVVIGIITYFAILMIERDEFLISNFKKILKRFSAKT